MLVIVLAISPALFDPVFGWFNFERPGDEPHALIFVLIVAIFVLLFLRPARAVRTPTRTSARSACWSRRWAASGSTAERAAALPDGPRLVVVIARLQRGRERRRRWSRPCPQMVEGYHVVPRGGDDGSEDQTAAVAREAGALVAELPIRPGRRAWRSASGYEIALKMSADIVVTLDADGQHLPEELDIDDRARSCAARPTT